MWKLHLLDLSYVVVEIQHHPSDGELDPGCMAPGVHTAADVGEVGSTAEAALGDHRIRKTSYLSRSTQFL